MTSPDSRAEVPAPDAAIQALGLNDGAVVLVHASLRRVGPAAGALLPALLDVLGPQGTLVVPTFTAGNSTTSPAYRRATVGMSERERAAYRDAMPPFDPRLMPSQGMGRLAESVRRLPGAVRSAHPQTSFAAFGAAAPQLMADHRQDCHLGEESPLAQLYATGAQVLLIGVGYEVCSAFHLAEYRVPGMPAREYRCVVLRDGRRQWLSYQDLDLDDSDFGALGVAYEQQDSLRSVPAVRRGRVGGADARLLPLHDAVDFARGWLAGNRSHRRAPNESQEAPGYLH